MSKQNPAPPSNDFFNRIISGAIPGTSTSNGASPPNNAAGLPNSGGNAGGMLTVGSVDTILQHGGLDGATTLGSMNAIINIPEGVFKGEIFTAFQSFAGNIQTLPKQVKALLSIGVQSFTNARAFSPGIISQSPGQAPAR